MCRNLISPPIFIVGHPRSGTTWLSELLGSHSRLASGTETHLFNYYLERLFRGRDKWLGDWVDDTTLDQLIAQFVEGVFQAKLATTCKTRIVEKTPPHRHWLDQITSLFPGAKIVHCIRDGRDVALSMLAMRRRTGAQWIPETLEACAERWKESMELLAKCKNEMADSFVEVHYEHVLCSPEDQLQRLLGQLNEIDSSQEVRRMLAARPIWANQHEKWRHQLTPSQQQLFVEVAGGTLEVLGYPV